MISERIKELRDKAGLSQSELARRLSISRASVNAWESGLSTPTAIYLVELSNIFNVSTDFLLGLDSRETIDVSTLSPEELKIIYDLITYFKQNK